MHKSLPNRAIEWRRSTLILLDQRVLPDRIEFLLIKSVAATHRAIQAMAVRGAPAIGISAAFGVVLSALSHAGKNNHQARAAIEADIEYLASARPTAVNLSWALQRMQTCLNENNTQDRLAALERTALAIHEQDIAANKTMGRLGAKYIQAQSNVMTHCNAGALATGGYGTALGVIRSAFSQGKVQTVFAGETRPWWQGSRLTAWELQQEQIPVQLLCDAAAASALREHNIEWVIVGADRVAANGDVANKIGTYGLAVLARHLGKKFMVVAPASSIDLSSPSGAAIKIEQRAAHEITQVDGKMLTARGVKAWNPVFDVTPAGLIDVLVTELGVVENPDTGRIAQLFAG